MLDNRADNRCEIQDIVREGNVLCYFLSLLEVRSTSTYLFRKLFRQSFLFNFYLNFYLIETFILEIIIIYLFIIFRSFLAKRQECELCTNRFYISLMYFFFFFFYFFLYFSLGIYQVVLQSIFIRDYDKCVNAHVLNERFFKSNNKYLPFKCKDHRHYTDRF